MYSNNLKVDQTSIKQVITLFFLKFMITCQIAVLIHFAKVQVCIFGPNSKKDTGPKVYLGIKSNT